MTQKDIDRLKELESKSQLTDKEVAQYEFLKKKAKNDEHIEQFRKNQNEPYESKRSRSVNLAWEFYKNVEVDKRCYVAVGGLDSITLYLFLRSIVRFSSRSAVTMKCPCSQLWTVTRNDSTCTSAPPILPA